MDDNLGSVYDELLDRGISIVDLYIYNCLVNDDMGFSDAEETLESRFKKIKNNYANDGECRDLSYHIANVGVDLKDGKTNSMDIDIAAFTYNDAKYIRKEIQVNNEDIYYLYIYLNVFSNNEKELEFLLKKLKNMEKYKNFR